LTTLICVLDGGVYDTTSRVITSPQEIIVLRYIDIYSPCNFTSSYLITPMELFPMRQTLGQRD
jgi:hypothetical protein